MESLTKQQFFFIIESEEEKFFLFNKSSEVNIEVKVVNFERVFFSVFKGLKFQRKEELQDDLYDDILGRIREVFWIDEEILKEEIVLVEMLFISITFGFILVFKLNIFEVDLEFYLKYDSVYFLKNEEI